MYEVARPLSINLKGGYHISWGHMGLYDFMLFFVLKSISLIKHAKKRRIDAAGEKQGASMMSGRISQRSSFPALGWPSNKADYVL